MDTKVALDQTFAPSGTADRAADEFSGNVLPPSLDGRPEGGDTVPDAPSLAEQFAGIVYFSEMAADSRDDRRPTRRRNVGRMSGGESARSARGRRIPTRPWRLPAVDRNPKT